MPSAARQYHRAAFRATSQTRLSHIVRARPPVNHRVSQCVAALSQPPLDAKCEPGSSNRSRRATTYRDAPGADADAAASEEVEVTDPRHPLYRRRFRLLSVVQ